MLTSTPVNAIATIAAGSNPPQTILKKLVDQLVNAFLPAAVRNNNLIINEIPDKIQAETNENTLTAVVKGLLSAVIHNAKDSCIRISARVVYGKMVEIFVKDQNSYHTYAIACSLQDVVPLAETIGGDINIINQREKITTVSFTFPAMPM